MDQLNEKVQIFKRIFEEHTGQRLQYIVRAPGRVNLIGDHIDYHGFAVLPMAIENCIWLGCSFNKPNKTNFDGQLGDNNSSPLGKLRILNKDHEMYKPFEANHSFFHGSQLDQSHRWFHYILCGYHGVLAENILNIPAEKLFDYSKRALSSSENTSDGNQLDLKLIGLADLTVLVDGNLPPASGLSSSSALVCASALATCLLLEESKSNRNDDINMSCSPMSSIDYEILAESCSKFEHLIGTHGGGMDQAVILTAQLGYAKFVEFFPKFKCENVCLPSGITWLVSHCGNNYAKAATSGFNSRVLETKLGAALIAQILGANQIKQDQTITLGRVKQDLFAHKSSYEIVTILKEKVFKKDEYTIDEIASIIGITRELLIDRFGSSEQILSEDLQNRVKLLSRCQHVFEEAERVEKFRYICATVDKNNVRELGNLMTQSHCSLRDNYECSHPDLDKLVSVALEAGALGARLTGAGWGGCIVSMVEAAKKDFVTQQLKQASRFTFVTEPQAGCGVIKVD